MVSLRKWARSLRKKQRCYPLRYDYEQWHGTRSMREKTRFFATRYYEYESLESYFDGYSIAGNRLAQLQVPSTLLTASDDPVIPVRDVETLPDNPYLEVWVTRLGGHCGYLKNWKLESWTEDLIADRFLNRAPIPLEFGEQMA